MKHGSGIEESLDLGTDPYPGLDTGSVFYFSTWRDRL